MSASNLGANFALLQRINQPVINKLLMVDAKAELLVGNGSGPGLLDPTTSKNGDILIRDDNEEVGVKWGVLDESKSNSVESIDTVTVLDKDVISEQEKDKISLFGTFGQIGPFGQGSNDLGSKTTFSLLAAADLAGAFSPSATPTPLVYKYVNNVSTLHDTLAITDHFGNVAMSSDGKYAAHFGVSLLGFRLKIYYSADVDATPWSTTTPFTTTAIGFVPTSTSGIGTEVSTMYFDRDASRIILGDSVSAKAEVWVRTGTNTWALEQDLTPLVTSPIGKLGTAVSISPDGDIAIASESPLSGSNPGKVHIFTRSGSTWTIAQTVTDSRPNAAFGAFCALTQDVLVVGARQFNEGSGRAYVYTADSAGVFTLAQTLSPPDGSLTAGANFGYTVATPDDGKLIAVSAPFNAVAPTDGDSFIWKRRQGDVWEFDTRLGLASPVAAENFGASLFSHDGSQLSVATFGVGLAATYAYSVVDTGSVVAADVKLVPLYEDPVTPPEGTIVYDATLQKLKFYNGAAWEVVTSS